MKNDFEMIVAKLPEDLPHANIYPLGDLHIGSQHFNEEAFKRWKTMVLSDPYSYVVLVGDMIENGLRNSKTLVYESTMRPFEQKEWLKRELEPMKDKIIGAVRGNHEQRSVNESDDCPLYDVMAKHDLEDLYRENMAFVKISLGKKSSSRQYTYTMALAHGAGKNKQNNFSYAIDGMDIFITGHLHTPQDNFKSKIVIDPYNNTVSMRDFLHLQVPSFNALGGYTLKGMYLPQSSNKIPVIHLSGIAKDVSVTWL